MINTVTTVVKRRQIRKQNCSHPDSLERKWQQLNYSLDECQATTKTKLERYKQNNGGY